MHCHLDHSRTNIRCFCADGSVKEEEEEEEVQDYKVKCLNNLAAAQLKLEQYEEALLTSRDVLALEPNNVKALFRTGKVRVSVHADTADVRSIRFDSYQSRNDY